MSGGGRHLYSTTPGKINVAEMMLLRKQGWKTKQLAEHFKCTIQSINVSIRKAKDRIEIVPELVKHSELHKGNLDTISQLGKINDVVLNELDRARRLVDREDKFVLEREELEDRVKADPGNSALVAELKEKANINFSSILKIQSNVIDISAEVRKQLELQIKIAETLYSATMMAQFQEEVLNAISRVSSPTRDAIIKELKQLRTLQGLVRMKK